MIRTRVGAAGCRQVRTRGMIAAGFDHWDSRAGDPNLHTHVVIANKVQGPDGVWRSVDGRTLHAATVTVSELYDALLGRRGDAPARRHLVVASSRSAAQPGVRARRRRGGPAGGVLDALRADPLRGRTLGEGVHGAAWSRAVAHGDDQGAPAPDPGNAPAEGGAGAAGSAGRLGQPCPHADRQGARRPGRTRPDRQLWAPPASERHRAGSAVGDRCPGHRGCLDPPLGVVDMEPGRRRPALLDDVADGLTAGPSRPDERPGDPGRASLLTHRRRDRAGTPPGRGGDVHLARALAGRAHDLGRLRDRPPVGHQPGRRPGRGLGT